MQALAEESQERLKSSVFSCLLFLHSHSRFFCNKLNVAADWVLLKGKVSFLTWIYLLAKKKNLLTMIYGGKIHEKSVNELNHLLFSQEYILSRLRFLENFSLFLLNKIRFVLINFYEVLQILKDRYIFLKIPTQNSHICFHKKKNITVSWL